MKDCLLKGISTKYLVFEPSAPVLHKTKHQMFGILYHRLLEMIPNLKKFNSTTRADALLTVFEDACLTLEQESRNNPEFFGKKITSFPEAGLIFEKISELVFSTSKNIEPKKLSRKREVTLRSPDEILLGSLDELVCETDRYTVIENKSSSIVKNGHLNRDYVEQLHFYSQLVFEEFGVYPSKIVLKGLDRTSVMTPDIELCKSLSTHARRLFKDISDLYYQRADVSLYTNPSEEACSACSLQLYCKSYWKHSKEFRIKNPFSIVFELVEIVSAGSGNQSSFVVRIIKGPYEGKVVVIDRIFPKRFPNVTFQVGSRFSANDLTIDLVSDRAKFGTKTQVYRI